MKTLLLTLAIVVAGLIQGPVFRQPCHGALLAQSQEKRLPPGEWCQRPAAQMDRRGHACSCHLHDCAKDPDYQNNRSAHTDNACLSYCDVKNCACEKMDCP